MSLETGLSPEILRKICLIFAQYEPIDEVLLYGSRAMGNYRPGSDIDLTLKGEGLDLKTLNKVSNDLDDLLLPFSFDLSIFDQIENLELVDHIRRVGVRVYARRAEHEKY